MTRSAWGTVTASVGYFLRALAAAAAALVPARWHLRWEAIDLARARRVLTIPGAVTVIGVSGFCLLRTLVPARYHPDYHALDLISQRAVDETARLAGPGGCIVLLVCEVRGPGDAATGHQRDFVVRQLHQAAGLKLTGLESITHAQIAARPTIVGVTASRYCEIVQHHPEADVMLSLAGPPVFDGTPTLAIPRRRPRYVSVCLAGGDVSACLANGLVQVALGPRIGAGRAPAHEPPTPQEWFDRWYTVQRAKHE